jgi:hypothetical protein
MFQSKFQFMSKVSTSIDFQAKSNHVSTAYMLPLSLGTLALPKLRLWSPIYGLQINGVVGAGFCLVLLWSGDVGSAGKGDFSRR